MVVTNAMTRHRVRDGSRSWQELIPINGKRVRKPVEILATFRETKAQRLRASQICQTQNTDWRESTGGMGRRECSPAATSVSDRSVSLSDSSQIASQVSPASSDRAGDSGVTGICSGVSAQQHTEVRSRFGREQHEFDDSQQDLRLSFWQHEVASFSAFFEQHRPHAPTPASSDCVRNDAAVKARIRW